MSKAMRQKSAKAEHASETSSEAVNDLVFDEACGPQWDNKDTGPALLEAVLARGNMQQAWKRVKANKGSAGV